MIEDVATDRGWADIIRSAAANEKVPGGLQLVSAISFALFRLVECAPAPAMAAPMCDGRFPRPEGGGQFGGLDKIDRCSNRRKDFVG
jgi:hypothetical protein